MPIPKKENFPKPPQNEKLSWTTFRYAARSSESILYGTARFPDRVTRDELTHGVLQACASQAHLLHQQWNCFNVNLLIVAVV